jgi:tRNA A-37 threonylcarbamoyl transferase component Bud32
MCGASTSLYTPVVLQVVQQVESLHKRGLIHGDIKGRNILLKVCPYTGIILSAHLTDWGSLAHLGGDTTELSTR